MATKLGDITLSKGEGNTLTLSTKEKYVNDDVWFNIDVIDGSVTPTFSQNNVSLSNTDNGISISAGCTITSGFVSSSSTPGTTQYISGVTIPVPEGNTPNTFSVTLPNGDNDTITLTFAVDSNGNWSFE